jgi:RHS repeat-associated protein
MQFLSRTLVAGNLCYQWDIDNFEYPPFGMMMQERSFTSNTGDNKFGFNGMEKDDDLQGSGNAYNFGARIYDPRSARWMSTDPLEAKYPMFSSYISMNNSPIWLIDPNGMEAKESNITFEKGNGTSDKDLKTLKRQVLFLRVFSSNYRRMYRDMRRSGECYVFRTTSDKNNVNYLDVNNPENESGSNIINIHIGSNSIWEIRKDIAHETGHAWTTLKGFTPWYETFQPPKMPVPEVYVGPDEDKRKEIDEKNKNAWEEYYKSYDEFYAKILKQSEVNSRTKELDAMHIQDIVMSDIGRFPFFRKKNGTKPELDYSGGTILVQTLSIHGNPSYEIRIGVYKSERKAEYYDKKRNIYEEFNRSDYLPKIN